MQAAHIAPLWHGCLIKPILYRRSHWYHGLCAGCVEALSRDRALLLAFWTVHRPPSSTALLLALRLLHALAPAPPAAWAAAAQGGALYLLTALLPVTPAPAHEAVSLRMPPASVYKMNNAYRLPQMLKPPAAWAAAAQGGKLHLLTALLPMRSRPHMAR